ncbi:MAG: histone deacetylase [Leptospiraceae bacterium]|nr:histone deacetylase [Leptospiraceae bacterium]MDW8306221.1 histone deacetylase [Leptospiraceae bacterium]
MFDFLSSLFFREFLRAEEFEPSKHKRGFVYSHYYAGLPETTIIPVRKYSELYRKIKEHPILKKLPIFEVKGEVSRQDLLRVHTPEYLQDLYELNLTPEIERSEIIVTHDILEYFLYGTMGTIQAMEMAFASGGVFMNLSGGYHHAFRDHAEGFCLINDVAVGIEKLLDRYKASVLIIDLDVHQGNGVVHYFQDRKDVFVFNLHQSDNYPIKEKGHLDIGLPSGTEGAEYLKALEEALLQIRQRFHPDFLVYIAGVDPYEKDLLGGFMLTKEDLRQREILVKQSLEYWNIPCTIVLAGGYTPKLDELVSLHLQTAEVFML